MTKITIQTDADFTFLLLLPLKGKRSARVVTTSGSLGKGRQIRWYVSGRVYTKMADTPENAKLTKEWLAA
jgi:hypothetical protein